MDNSIIGLGTEVKINVHIEPLPSLPTEENPDKKTMHMSDYDFNVKFFTRANKSVTIDKVYMVKQDDDNYIAVVDTSELGAGVLQMIVTAMIPDGDCGEDNVRTEVTPPITTNIQITK